jgi:hypothetical protein
MRSPVTGENPLAIGPLENQKNPKLLDEGRSMLTPETQNVTHPKI